MSCPPLCPPEKNRFPWLFVALSGVSVRSSRYPALRQPDKHCRTASRSGPGALRAQGTSTGAGRRQRQRPVGPAACPYRDDRTVTIGTVGPNRIATTGTLSEPTIPVSPQAAEPTVPERESVQEAFRGALLCQRVRKSSLPGKARGFRVQEDTVKRHAGLDVVMAFDGVPIGIGDGLAEDGRLPGGLPRTRAAARRGRDVSTPRPSRPPPRGGPSTDAPAGRPRPRCVPQACRRR